MCGFKREKVTIKGGRRGVEFIFQILHMLQLGQLEGRLACIYREDTVMARVKAVSEGQGAADIRRKLVALRGQVAVLPANAKVEVDAGTLVSILSAADPALLADEISPQEAAQILQMSRPSVMRLIEKGVLHPRKILSRNRLSRAEVLAYRYRHDPERRQALENLTAFSDEFDF